MDSFSSKKIHKKIESISAFLKKTVRSKIEPQRHGGQGKISHKILFIGIWSQIMNAHKVETVLTEDGTLLLKELPFHAGDAVEVILLERPKTQQDTIILQKSGSNLYPLQGKQPYRYDEPFEPGYRDYLKGISSIMSEWESDADECAYSDL